MDNLVIHDKQLLYGHGLLFWVPFLFMSEYIRKRTSIILWGVAETKKRHKNIIYSLFSKIQVKVLRSFKFVGTLSVEDMDKIINWFRLSNVIVIGYIRDTYYEFKEYKYVFSYSSPTKIMISHSSFSHNYHLEIFELLAPFKQENIQIICPLSYGNKEYREIVIERGKYFFGDKFIYYDELMSRESYNSLLASIDIYISNAVIQTGLYVINFCICTGRKIYLRANNFNWMSHQGFKICNVSELKGIEYKELIEQPDSEWLKHNDKLANQIFSLAPQIELWKQIYC